jgi:hypothetical protein
MFFGISVHTVRAGEQAFERNVMQGVAAQGVHKVSIKVSMELEEV